MKKEDHIRDGGDVYTPRLQQDRKGVVIAAEMFCELDDQEEAVNFLL
jgi:hypothetical protein